MKALLLLLFVGYNVLVAASLLLKIGAGCYRAWRPAQKAVKDERARAMLRHKGWANPAWRNERAAQSA